MKAGTNKDFSMDYVVYISYNLIYNNPRLIIKTDGTARNLNM